MKKAIEIYERRYGLVDERTCKIMRTIALVYLRADRFEEALNELKLVLDLERLIFGEASAQLAKTLKIVGSLMIILKNSANKTEINA